MGLDQFVSLDAEDALWQRVFVIAPLVVIGTREGDGYNLAPKHAAMPLGPKDMFGFVCTPAHATYGNAKKAGAFTVSYPWPDQVTIASLTASPRQGGPEGEQPVLEQLPTVPAARIDGVFLDNSYLMLECELDRVVEDLGDHGLLIGRIVAAHVHEKALRTSDRDDQQHIFEAPLLAYLNPGRYSVIRDSQAFPFPAECRF